MRNHSLTLLVFLLSATLSVFASEQAIRNGDDFKFDREILFSGRNFWPMLSSHCLINPGQEFYAAYAPLREEPMFKESGIVYVNYTKELPAGVFAPEDLLTSAQRAARQKNPKRGFPFLIRYSGTRPPHVVAGGNASADRAAYQRWKQENPEFVAFEQSEWDNELVMQEFSISKEKDPQKRRLYQQQFPAPKNREEGVKLARKLHGMVNDFYFGDTGKLSFMRAGWCFDHLSAALGASLLCLETTNTMTGDVETYRWQVSMPFTRGAARQFSLPWQWYIANFYNGYDSRGNWQNDTFCNTFEEKEQWGAFKGMSRSLVRRNLYLAYLAGASFLELENWSCLLLKYDPKQDKISLAPSGEDFKVFHTFTRTLADRGTPYTPLLLLVPFSQGYPNWGGRPWSLFDYEQSDYMTDVLFYTLVPGFPKHDWMRKGYEGCLTNAPLGDLFDVFAADAPTPDNLRALQNSNYKVAVLSGTQKIAPESIRELQNWVDRGGTLILNAANLEQLPESFTGVTLAAQTVAGGKTACIAADGKTFALNTRYSLPTATRADAAPLVRDELGNVLIYSRNAGRGKVIVTMPRFLAPEPFGGESDYRQLASGQTGSALLQWLLASQMRPHLPFELRGNVQYGFNKTRSGWLIYLINNKGVTKFTDIAESVNPAAAASVTIPGTGGFQARQFTPATGFAPLPDSETLQVQVPAGEIVVIELTRVPTSTGRMR